MGKITLKEREAMGLYYRCDDVKSRSDRRRLKYEAIDGIFDRLRVLRTEEALRDVKAFNETTKAEMMNETRKNLLQELSKRKQKLDLEYVEYVKETRDIIIEYIKTLYGEYKIETNQEFEDMYSCIEPALKNLESMCKEARVSQFYSSNSKSEYDKLYTDLIEKIDIRFVRYAPKRILQTKSFLKKLKIVDNETLKAFILRVKSLGLFDDPEIKTVVCDYNNKCVNFYYEQQSKKNAGEIEPETKSGDGDCDCN